MTVLMQRLGTEAKFEDFNNNNNNNIINTYLKWVACNNQHKSQFFTAGPTVKRIDKIYYFIHVGNK